MFMIESFLKKELMGNDCWQDREFNYGCLNLSENYNTFLLCILKMFQKAKHIIVLETQKNALILFF